MTTDHGQDQPYPDDHDGTDWDAALAELDGADIVDLNARRAGRVADVGDQDQDGSEVQGDAESIPTELVAFGGPVDPVDVVPFGPQSRRDRKPILPVWMRSRSEAITAATYAARDAGYIAGYHATRVPKYGAKLAFYAPLGAARTLGRLVRWATAEEGNWSLRQQAATRNEGDLWLKLDKQRQRQARWRWTLVLLGLVAALIGLSVLLYGPVPSWVPWALLTVAVPVLARLGRPLDKPITDRVTEGPRYRKLTADLVRRALTSLGMAGINSAVAKDPNAITFPTEIHRDGPGHLAIIDLPYGVEAAEVMARRGKLASALRLPMDQVWPELDRTHTGRLALWVGYEPASVMKPPTWPLIKTGKVDVFTPFPFATDPRLRVINAQIIARNWLIGGQPGSGKTFALRDLVLACALDARVEIRGYELKGVGDFKALEPVCVEYGNGFDDDTIGRAAALFDWLYTECQRRSERIDFYAAKGMARENKVTPELASLKGSGLHPLVVFMDEVQELFQHGQFGKKAGEVAEKCIKLGRALGITILLGTQIPDKDSLPTGITRNVNTRFCLSVMDQVANDMILGTSAYKNGYRATTFEPGDDAGWGIAVGLGKPAAYRSFYVDNDQAADIVTRAIGYRQTAGTMPTAPSTRDTGPSYDLLADCLTVFPTDDDTAWNETLIERLAALRSDVYAGWKPAQLTAALAIHGVKVDQRARRIDGKTINKRGPARDDITNAVAERNRRRAAD